MVTALLVAGCAPSPEESDGVRLVLSTQEIGPGTTFEVRFDQAVAKGSEISGESLPSPLLFSPPVFGRFRYTSSRSGLFTLDAPLSLGTRYTVTLIPGLRQADGQRSRAKLRRYIQTPGFGVVDWSGPRSSTNAYSAPEFLVWFNADVRATDFSSRGGFISADGLRVPAAVRQGTWDDQGAPWWTRPVVTWGDAFKEHHLSAQSNQSRQPPGPVVGPHWRDLGNLLVVTPARPLAAGRGWKLVLEPRFISADGQLYSDQQFQVDVGDVRPFTFETNQVHHVIHRPPWLEVEFSKKLSATLTNSFTNWVQIAPVPAQLSARVSGSTLSLVGDWQRKTNYTVHLLPGLPSAEGFALANATAFSVAVPPVEPRLYFPVFSTDQYASGGRVLPLLAVNVNRIHVRAKLLDEASIVHALRGYDSYFLDGTAGDYERGFQRLDYNLIPGRTVFDEGVPGPRTEDAAEQISLDWDRLLDGRRTGIVFLDAERGETSGSDLPNLGTQALVQLTDLGLVWKSGASELQVFVFSYRDGQPLPGVAMRLCSGENEPLGNAITDASGVARMKPHTNAVWLIARAGEDVHAVKVRDRNVRLGAFGMPWVWDSPADEGSRRVALFSDRDVYLPGETVNWKAVVRDFADGKPATPNGLAGRVRCLDARGKSFYETNVVLSELGSCAGSIPLPAGPRGEYHLMLHLGGQVHPLAVTVADYEPAAFEIAMSAKPAYGPGETIEIPITAHYFLGRQLDRAAVRWSLEAEDDPLQPDGFGGFTFVRTLVESVMGRTPGTFVSNGQGQISVGSACLVKVDVPTNPVAPQPRAVSVLAEVTDLNQQTLTRSEHFVLHSSEFYLGLKAFEQVLEPGKSLPVEVATVGTDGKPWPRPVKAMLSLQRMEWQSVLVQSVGRSARYRNEVTLTNVTTKEVLVEPPQKEPGTDHGFVGCSIAGFEVPPAGQYLLEVHARDAADREVVSSLSFYVTDRSKLAWDYRNETEVRLVPDKSRYEAGDIARLLVKTPISGTAWVTVEGDHVRRSFQTSLEGNAPVVNIPLEAADAPNIYASVAVVRGGDGSPHRIKEPEYRIGYTQLEVSDPATRLRVEVVPGATNYMPGDPITSDVRVTDHTGEPVPNAEVTLYAVDEGVLSMSDYATPDLHRVIFAPRALGVTTGISLPFLLSEDPERLVFHNKGYLGGGGGRERIRQHFLACAYWNASLRTGPDGRVSAGFLAPDSLTRYRVMAVVQASSHQFGSGQSAFSVSKPLMIEPALPRFANVTDRIPARAIVLNQSDQAGEVIVTLQLDDKARCLEPTRLEQRLQVAAHGSAVVEVPLAFVEAGAAQWIWKARFVDAKVATFADAVRSRLDVGTVLPLLRDVHLVRSAGSATNLLSSVNPQVLEGQGVVRLTLARSGLVGLGEAVGQLLQYPYGCAEQTSSSLLPWIVLSDSPELVQFAGRDATEASGAAKAGVERLFSMQTASGGLAYWPGGHEPMLWASAYGGFVLAEARQAGIAVADDLFSRLTDYLSAQLRITEGAAVTPGDICLTLYALAVAGKSEPAYLGAWFDRRNGLGAEERAWLALGLAATPGSDKRSVLELLQTNAVTSAPTAAFSCPARQRAVRLLALIASQPDSPEIARIASELLEARSEWSTTQGNAWVLLAMRQYFRLMEKTSAAAGGTLTWGDQATTFQLSESERTYSQQWRFDRAHPGQGLALDPSPGATLFAHVTVEARPAQNSQTEQDHGFALRRRYDRLDENNDPQSVDTLRVGDRILVTLHVALQETARYVAVDDPLPSLFEPVNSQFQTQQTRALASSRRPLIDESLEWWSDFRETRTDRVLFFANDLAPGNYVIHYVARVRATGTATAPPAKVEEMYRPSRFGLSATQNLTARDSQ